jgi:hypothetical protein
MLIEITVGIVVLILMIVGAAVVKRRKDPLKVIGEAVIEADTFKQRLRTALSESDPVLLKETLMLSGPVLEVSREGMKAIEKIKRKMKKKGQIEESRLEDYADSFDDIWIIVEILRLAYTKLQDGKITFDQFRKLMLEEIEDLERMNDRHRLLRQA